MIADLQPLAKQIVELDKVPDKNLFIKAVQKYTSTVESALINYIHTVDSDISKNINEFVPKAKETGWISAGGWYWQIARVAGQVNDKITEFPESFDVQTNDIDQNYIQAYLYKKAKIVEEVQKVLVRDQSLDEYINSVGNSEESGLSKIWGYIKNSFTWLTMRTVDQLATDDPIITLSNLGHGLI
jgi:conjugal transfer/type IV secretion protein DotA/TraY